jgi:hypothetical protein
VARCKAGNFGKVLTNRRCDERSVGWHDGIMLQAHFSTVTAARFFRQTRSHLMNALCVLLVLAASPAALSHCDALDGPVIMTAKRAIAANDVTPMLKWVNKDAENEIRQAFALTMKVRGLGPDAQTVADKHFFEAVVRVHRAGEGEAFTGLKPAGATDPGLAAADHALEAGSVDRVERDLNAAIGRELRRRFNEAKEKKAHAEESVEAGRAFVAAYVSYAHFVETLHQLGRTGAQASHHLHEGEGTKDPH